jgi:hypothetical protein
MTDEDYQVVPPLLGFPQEQHIAPEYNCPYYTCVMGPFRVFVWEGLDAEWLIQAVVNDPQQDITKQFTSANTRHYRVGRDPITLQCVIRDITSEGNDNAHAPTGTNENDMALHV